MVKKLLVGVALVVATVVAAYAWRQRDAAEGHENHAAAAPAAPQPQDGTARGEIEIDGRRRQLIGVTITAARRKTMAPELRATGTVVYDETRQSEINTLVEGWIRELHANYTGKAVRRGEPLFTLYSPELVTTQNEYLLAMRGHAQAGSATVQGVREYSERLMEAARERLLRWQMTPEDIAELEKRGRATETVTFRSPVTGIIVEKAAVEGMQVMPGEMLFRVADLSTVWVEAEVYESDIASLRTGAGAVVTVDAFRGESFPGRVTYIYPALTPETRTARVRVELANRRGLLRPNMFATVTVDVPASSAVVVPADAVVDSGDRALVFLAEGEGRFVPRDVTTGRRVEGDIEVLSGLKEGDQVAASATFFIDSESQLRGAVAAYAPQAQSAPAPAEGAGPAQPRATLTLRTTPDPPRTGDNTFEVTVRDAAGAAVTDAAVNLVLSMPAMPSMNMPAMRTSVALSHQANGVYRATGQLPMGGRWDTTITATRNGQAIGRANGAVMAR